MNDPSGNARAGDFERQLRDMNEALLVSSVHQHELTEMAQRAEAAAANEIAERKQAESLIQCQKASLELLVNGEPIERVLDFLARSMESQSQGKFLVAIHLMEADGHHFGYVAAPSLPAQLRAGDPGNGRAPGVGRVQLGRGIARADGRPRFRGRDALACVHRGDAFARTAWLFHHAHRVGPRPAHSGHFCHLLPRAGRPQRARSAVGGCREPHGGARDRPQADRAGAARKRGAFPHAGRQHVPVRLDRRRQGLDQLVQPALVRLHRDHAGRDAGLGLEEGASSRSRRSRGRAPPALVGHRRAVGRHLPAARQGRRVPLVPFPRASHPR